jgi:hypothetical protein
LPQVCSKAGTCIDPGTCAVDEDCDGGKVCDAGSKTCVPGSGCGAPKLVAEQIPPNFLLVLDESDAIHLCPNDPQKGIGYCSDGCCKFQKINLPRRHRQRHHEASPGLCGLHRDLTADLFQ